MVNYQEVRVKLKNTQLNKLKFAANNKTVTALFFAADFNIFSCVFVSLTLIVIFYNTSLHFLEKISI